MNCPARSVSSPIVNHTTEPETSLASPLWTNVQSTASDIANAAASATTPMIAPPPGRRLPNRKIRSAEASGTSAMTHA